VVWKERRMEEKTEKERVNKEEEGKGLGEGRSS